MWDCTASHAKNPGEIAIASTSSTGSANIYATFDPSATSELLLHASRHLPDTKPTVLVDGGVENFHEAVNELVESGLLKRLLARTEITFSNSLIESWWRVLKHQWLYLNTLDTVNSVRKLVTFYVQEHNAISRRC